MKLTSIKLYSTSLLSIALFSCNNNVETPSETNEIDPIILNEEFTENKMGWVEERTDFHYLDVDNGVYHLESLDTSSSTTRSSAGPLCDSFLWNLPEKYKISSEINFLSSTSSDPSFGILLISASLEYKFQVHSSGQVEVKEYDYNTGMEMILLSGDIIDIETSYPFLLEITIDGLNFEFKVNNTEFGSGELKAESWFDLRLFVSNQSSIEIDFLRIEED